MIYEIIDTITLLKIIPTIATFIYDISIITILLLDI